MNDRGALGGCEGMGTRLGGLVVMKGWGDGYGGLVTVRGWETVMRVGGGCEGSGGVGEDREEVRGSWDWLWGSGESAMEQGVGLRVLQLLRETGSGCKGMGPGTGLQRGERL